MTAWRTITADQYRKMEDLPGHDGWDEAYVNGIEVWDVSGDLNENGKVVLHTEGTNPIVVDVDHPIRVR